MNVSSSGFADFSAFGTLGGLSDGDALSEVTLNC